MAIIMTVPQGRGIRTSENFTAGERPKYPRDLFSMLYPNGQPLLAITSRMPREKAKDPHVEKFVKVLPDRVADITSIHTDVALSNSYTASVNARDTVLYITVSDGAFYKRLRRGHTAKLRKVGNVMYDTFGQVMDAYAGSSTTSIIVFKTFEPTVDTANGAAPELCDTFLLISSSQKEGASMPDAVKWGKVKMENECQIIETAYKVSGTAEATELITGSALAQEKKEKFEEHGMSLEDAFLWSQLSTSVNSDTDEVERTMMGMVEMIKRYAPQNVFNYVTDADFAGNKWIDTAANGNGYDYFDKIGEALRKYGEPERLGLCGASVFNAINKLARITGTLLLETNQSELGFHIQTLNMGGVILHLTTHKTFTYNAEDNAILVYSPKNMKEYELRTTQTRAYPKGLMDGTYESWLTETTFIYENPFEFAYIQGVGLDNTLTP